MCAPVLNQDFVWSGWGMLVRFQKGQGGVHQFFIRNGWAPFRAFAVHGCFRQDGRSPVDGGDDPEGLEDARRVEVDVQQQLRAGFQVGQVRPEDRPARPVDVHAGHAKAFEQVRAAKCYISTIGNLERQAEVELAAFMHIFHPRPEGYTLNDVRKMRV